MRGVDGLRADAHWDVDLRIVSAKYGLLAADEPVSPYNETFSGMGRTAVRHRAAKSGIAGDVRQALNAAADLAIVALGADYLTAASLEDGDVHTPSTTLLLCAPPWAGASWLGRPSQKVALGTTEARRFRCGFIALKGEIAGRILSALAEEAGTGVPTWATSDLLLDRLARQDLQLAQAA